MTNEKHEVKLSISKEQLAGLPQARLEGKLHVIDNAADAKAAIDDIRSAKIVGFDTETRPSFKKGHTNMVALVQIATKRDCYLFRINKTGLIDEIKQLLEDPTVTKVGLSLHDDFLNLNKICDLTPRGFIDLQQYVKQVGIVDNSLSRIHGIIFGLRISKAQRLSNWEATNLSERQQTYAAIDAEACLRIFESLNNGVFHPEDSPYICPDDDPASAN